MKHALLLVVLGWLTLGQAAAQSSKPATHYLAGAVPVKNGVVVFEETFSLPGKTKAQLFDSLQRYTSQLIEVKEKLPTSRITELSPEEGLIAASVEEYLWFKRNSFVWDRTKFYFQLLFKVSDGKVEATMRRIHYLYEATEVSGIETRYLAEDWITDKEALNRQGTKLTRIAGKKFRVKTIDRKNEIFQGALKACQ